MMSDNIVKTRLTDEDKAKWQQFCHTNGFSEAKMLKMMINKIAPDIANVTDIKIGKNNKVTIRLSKNDAEKLLNQAKEEGYITTTNWVTSCVLANLHREPILSKPEIQALRESNRYLAAIGRNLNQMTRVLNIDFRQSNKVTREMIEELNSRLENHKAEVSKLIDKNCKRWEIDDDEQGAA